MDTTLILGLLAIFVALCGVLAGLYLIYRNTNVRIDAVNAQLIEAKAYQGQTAEAFGEIQSTRARSLQHRQQTPIPSGEER